MVLVFGDIDAALRRFKKACIAAGVFTEMKRHDYYVPPSRRRRDKSAKARQKARKAAKRRLEEGETR